MTAFASTDTALEALRLGAADYVDKSPNAVRRTAAAGPQGARAQAAAAGERPAQAGAADVAPVLEHHRQQRRRWWRMFQLIETIAPTSSTVLITGESGTGKELVARAIHFNSPRKRSAVRRAQLRRAAGDAARLGAVRPHARRVHRRGHEQEGADRGRREGDDLPRRDRRDEPRSCRSSCCASSRSASSAGSAAPRRSRPTSASSPPPTATCRRWCAEGKFREDLFYRINVIPVRLPALRERGDDIPLLAEHFVARVRGADGEGRSRASPGAALALPAGLRLARQRPRARERDGARRRARADAVRSWPRACRTRSARRPAAVAPRSRPRQLGATCSEAGFDLEQHVQDIEREYIAEALRRAGGVKMKAAELLGPQLPVSSAIYMKKYDLAVEARSGSARGSQLGSGLGTPAEPSTRVSKLRAGSSRAEPRAPDTKI